MADQGVRRVGVAVLDSDMSLEQDLAGALAGTIPVHVARIDYPGMVTTEALAVAREASLVAMRQLAKAQPDLLVYACTSGSFFGGLAGNAKYRVTASREMGVPVMSATDAVVHALTRLGARRIGLVTPYDRDVTAKLVDVLTGAGYEVAAASLLFGDAVVDDVTLQTLPSATLLEHVRSVSADVDAVLVSCTGIRALELIERLEATAGVPVVTSNLAIARLILDAAAEAATSRGGRVLGLPRAEIDLAGVRHD